MVDVNTKVFGYNIKYAPNIDAMEEYARISDKNSYMFNSMTENAPIEFMDLDFTNSGEFFFIQKTDGEIIGSVSFDDDKIDDNIIEFGGISVHEDHLREGIASQLLWSIMNHVNQQGKTLNIDMITNDGSRFLSNTIPSMITDFSNLKIVIQDQDVSLNSDGYCSIPKIVSCEDVTINSDAYTSGLGVKKLLSNMWNASFS